MRKEVKLKAARLALAATQENRSNEGSYGIWHPLYGDSIYCL
jgi:hypothetical protein